jgi:hypothetical protein
VHFEIEPNQYVVRVYGDDKDNYIASAQIRKYGDRGWMSSIVGKEFFFVLRDHFNEILEQVGVETLEGYVMDSMARLMRLSCRGRAKFEITHYGMCAGRRMPWVVFSKLEGVSK